MSRARLRQVVVRLAGWALISLEDSCAALDLAGREGLPGCAVH